MKKLHTWQAKTLAVLTLMLVGMLIRDAVSTLFASQWSLITTDWKAAASLSIALAIEALVLNVIFSKNGNAQQSSSHRQFHNQGNKQNNG